METQHNLSRVLEVVESGQEVGITRRKQMVARIVPAHEPLEFPDFVGRARAVWGGAWRGVSSEHLLDETRGNS